MQKTILGFTLKEIDAATCYLTIEGMKKLRPCRWAMDWMVYNGVQNVTVGLFRGEWMVKQPDAWLSHRASPYFGPENGWGWSTYLYGSSALVLSRYLKAYIMKHGRKS